MTMTTLIATPDSASAPPASPVEGESRFLIHGLDWDGYEKLLEVFGDDGPRLSYLDGMIELMSPHIAHERPKKRLAMMVEALTEELDIPRVSLGSTTFRRATAQRGAEPDECYYLTNRERLTGQAVGDLDVLPPPDLVIEIEMSSPLLDKLAIYARLGVAEIWRYDGEALTVLLLQPEGRYDASQRSRAFPFLPMDSFADWLRADDSNDEVRWIKAFRIWLREVVAPLYHP